MKTTAILTDIEGTTTDIQFVHRVLFPYAYEKLPAFLRQHGEAPAVAPILDQARDELGDPGADLDTLIGAFRNWIEQDRKVTPLKTLQGLIWVQGYRQGDFTGHLYRDAFEYLKRWHQEGIGLYVFSSGSVKAQKLLFGFSDFGDLTPLFSGYFDTTTGPKRDPESYRQIALSIGCPAGEILFLSDVTEELDAAREAGMRTCLLARDAQPESSSHPVAASFDDIAV